MACSKVISLNFVERTEETNDWMKELGQWKSRSVRLQDMAINRYIHYVRYEVFTAVTMKNGIFWNVTT
jgi:hypothetical protein